MLNRHLGCLQLALCVAGQARASGPDSSRPHTLALHDHGLIMSRKALPVAEPATWRALVDAMRADSATPRIFGKYFSADLAGAMVNFQPNQ